MLRIEKQFRRSLFHYMFCSNKIDSKKLEEGRKKAIELMITPMNIAVNANFMKATKQIKERHIHKMAAIKKGDYVIGEYFDFFNPFLFKGVQSSKYYKSMLKILEETFEKDNFY